MKLFTKLFQMVEEHSEFWKSEKRLDNAFPKGCKTRIYRFVLNLISTYLIPCSIPCFFYTSKSTRRIRLGVPAWMKLAKKKTKLKSITYTAS